MIRSSLNTAFRGNVVTFSAVLLCLFSLATAKAQDSERCIMHMFLFYLKHFVQHQISPVSKINSMFYFIAGQKYGKI